MSFSVEFAAATKSKAKGALDVAGSSLPSAVRTFLHQAIDKLPEADEDNPRVITVKAFGHLAHDYSSGSANATIEVKSIPLTE